MTVLDLDAPAPDASAHDVPREIDPGLTAGDRVFQLSARTIGMAVFAVTGAIALFLGYQAIPTLRHYGLSFFTETRWEPQLDKIGLASTLLGTVEVAAVALVVGFPLALLTALYISEYAPARLKSWLVALVDLMAAVPSIIFGAWGFFVLQPQAVPVARWLNQQLGWVPFFQVDADPNAPSYARSQYSASAFIAGLVVSLMVIPLACAVMRSVFAEAPLGEREAAYALGATRWGMIRTVVLPYGRGGIIGGTMLALGRALGETIAVLLIISTAFDLKVKILSIGTQTVSALIAGKFGDASAGQLSALLAAGFVLFAITIAVNTVAGVLVSRSRSGAGTDA